jgi:hypothetical protein
LALTVENEFWGWSGKYSKNRWEMHSFWLIFCSQDHKNPQISQIQQENITNRRHVPEFFVKKSGSGQ